MTHQEALAQLALQRAADEVVDAKLDRLTDRTWRATDQTLNGTIRSFLRETTLFQRLPFPQSESGSHEPIHTGNGRTTA